MPAPKSVTWTIEPHTLAKHAILEGYLRAWLPIMASANGRIVVLDGFAGPGEYAGGQRGSPLIALDTLLQHSSPAVRSQEVIFFFIEKDSARCEHLNKVLASRTVPFTAKYRVTCGTFDETMSDLLDKLEEQSLRLAPTFAFVDPFGYSATPMSTISRLMRHPKCEVLVNFMHEEINRFLSVENAANQGHYDALFGTSEWRTVIAQPLPPKEREQKLHDIYSQQLRSVGGARHVRSFRMRNMQNRTDYYLFFGTNSLTGFDKMKQAMWRVDPSGAFSFSDCTDPNQSVLFSPEPDYAYLKTLLQARFRGQTVTVGGIEEYVVAETPFHSSQYKTSVLKPMERAGELTVITADPKRRAGTFGNRLMRVKIL